MYYTLMQRDDISQIYNRHGWIAQTDRQTASIYMTIYIKIWSNNYLRISLAVLLLVSLKEYKKLLSPLLGSSLIIYMCHYYDYTTLIYYVGMSLSLSLSYPLNAQATVLLLYHSPLCPRTHTHIILLWFIYPNLYAFITFHFFKISTPV